MSIMYNIQPYQKWLPSTESNSCIAHSSVCEDFALILKGTRISRNKCILQDAHRINTMDY